MYKIKRSFLFYEIYVLEGLPILYLRILPLQGIFRLYVINRRGKLSITSYGIGKSDKFSLYELIVYL